MTASQLTDIESLQHENADLRAENETLRRKMRHRTTVERAKCFVMFCAAMTEPEAMKALQAAASNSNLKIEDVCQSLLPAIELIDQCRAGKYR